METKASTVESFATLGIGLWTVSLINYLTSGISGLTYFLIVVGGVSTLFGLYLILPFQWKQELILEVLKRHRIPRIVKSLGWLLVVVLFGVGLLQSEVAWMKITGLTIMIIAYIVFYIGMWRMTKDKGKSTGKTVAA